MKKLLVLVSAFLYSISAHSYESLHEIQTTRGESVKYLYLEGQGDVLANVVLFPGGHGRIKASEDGPKGLNGNFLIRTRDQMAAQGFNVISVDAPSGKQQPGKLGGMFQSGFRRSTEHASDIKDLIKKIKEENSLYEMTAQGKKWWGDPSSPDYDKDGKEPFGKTSIKRKIGSIFSENDQFVLRTLFYPFNVRFGYTEENEKQFKADLQEIRPKLDEMFDFEKKIAEQTQMNFEKMKCSSSYLYLRSGLIERWTTLNEFGTYPDMITPLKM